MDNYKTMVSVCMITYNHEAYIAEAIEGVLMQKTNFPIELVIGEDCSNDRTREICKVYKEKHPNIIKLRLPEKNLGMMNNFIENLKACSGKYIALCEGDDYWIDPYKLQKQVNFLEEHPDYSICSALRYDLFLDGKLVKQEVTSYHEKDCDIMDLLNSNFLNTLNVMFRRINLPEQIPKWFKNVQFGDYLYWIIVAKSGKIHTINEFMAVYRYNNGVSRFFLNNYKSNLSLLYLYFNLLFQNFSIRAKIVLVKKIILQILILIQKKNALVLSIKFYSLNNRIISIIRRKYFKHELRKRVRKKDFTIICNNCWGGKIYEQMKIKYRSPFVGLYLFAPCYIKLLTNFKHYIKKDLLFVQNSKYELANSRRQENENYYPIGLIDNEIEIHFLHYHSREEAQQKWLRRVQRINFDNIFYVFSERDLCTHTELKAFDLLDLPNKVAFTASNYQDLKCSIFIKEYSEKGEIGDIYTSNEIIYSYFDPIKWLNSGIHGIPNK